MAASALGLQLMAAVLVLLIPIAVALVVPVSQRAQAFALLVAVIGGAGSLVGNLLVAVPSDAPARVLDASMAASLAASVALLAATRLGATGGAVFGAVWSLIVYQPVAAAVIGSVPPLTEVVWGAIDLAAVLLTHVAAAGSLLVLSFLPRPPHQEVLASRTGWGRSALATALLIVAGCAWMLGVDRVLDDGSPRILGNAVVGMFLGAVVWLATEKIARGTVRPVGLVGGAVAGWASLGMASAFLAPVALVASAVLGAAVGAAAAVRGSSSSAGPTRALSLSVFSAAIIGGIVLGLLADGIALASTGSLALVAAQVIAIAAVGLGSAFAGVLCWAAAVAVDAVLLRRQTRKRWAIPDSNR